MKSVLLGWKMVTASIFYHMPDHPDVLQEFIRQELDRVPELPELNRYLKWWNENLDGKVHSVRVAIKGLIAPTDLKYYSGEFKLS